MGWNPQINFKLRDDEVPFGNLIFDKQAIPLIEKVLLSIKSGQITDINVLRDYLKGGCFTNEEFSKLREEYEFIKQDIDVFKAICKTKLILGVENWTKRLDANLGYIVGSNTWIEKYKQLKICAAELYLTLVGKGHTFSAEDDAKYKKRYGDVLNATSSKERLEDILRKQYYEDLGAGVPNATEIWIQNQVDNGLMSEEQAEKRRRLFGGAMAASVKTTIDKKDEPSADEIADKTVSDIGVYVKEEPKEQIVLTTQLLADKIKELLLISDAVEQAIAYIEVFEQISSVCREVCIDVSKASEVATAFYDKSKGCTAGEVMNAISTVFGTVMLQMNSVMFNSVGKTISKDYWDNICKGKKSYNSGSNASKQDCIELDIVVLRDLVNDVSSVKDFMSASTCCEYIIKLIYECFSKEEVSIPNDILTLSSSIKDLPFGKVVSNTDECVRIIESNAYYSEIINKADVLVDVEWWHRNTSK